MNPPVDESAILAIQRPHPNLWKYYLLCCAAIPPAFPFVVLPAWFRYQTMKYRFTDEGISMSWGILFRREVIVNYARIQDIHLKSNVVERWFGLARVLVQTASGSSSAEMTLEGILEFEAVRDFLYDRMRGVKDHPSPKSGGASHPSGNDTELAAVLREIAGEMRAIRTTLDQKRGNAGEPRDV